jgi:hypothetical protein
MTTESRFPGLSLNGGPPKPRPKPRKVKTHATYLRLPDALREALDTYCEQEAVTMTIAVQTALKMMLSARHLWPPHPTNNKPLPGIE